MREAKAPTVNFELTRMVEWIALPDMPNYDIEVEGVHEFYAEGICVQNCSGTYHPHGTASIDDAINGLVEGAFCPLLEGQGNFGAYTKTAPAAAARYCFRGDTLIATDQGFKRIEDMHGGNMCMDKVDIGDNVLSHKGMLPASHWLYSGRRELFMVRSTYGVVVATDNEPFLVMNQKGNLHWKELSSLVPGDVVMRRRSDYTFGQPNRPIEFHQTFNSNRTETIHLTVSKFDCKVAEWLGYVIAEGTHSPYEILVGMADKNLMQRYVHLCRYIFGAGVRLRTYVKYPKEGGWQKKKVYYVALKGSGYSQFLEYLGQPVGNSYNRRVPDYILSASRKEVRAFLRMLFEGDGTARNSAGYSTRSFELATGIQTLLLAFGIRSALSKSVLSHNQRISIPKGGKLRSLKNKPPEIKLTVAAEDADKFWIEIGFQDKIRTNTYASQALPHGYLCAGYPRSAAAVFMTSWLAEYKGSLIYGKNNLSLWYEDKTDVAAIQVSPLGVFKNTRHAKLVLPNQAVFSHWFDWNKYSLQQHWPKAYKYLDRNLRQMYPDTILDIVQVDTDDTYDLTVPQAHSYVANGFVVHNTEVKLLRQTEYLLLDPYYLSVVPMVDNYDGSAKEPVYLPAKLPYVLATGAEGIAMGTTTKMPAFTLSSLKEAVLYWLTAKKPSAKKLAGIVQLSTPYGGKAVYDEEEMVALLTQNKASINWTCDYEQVSDTQIEVTGFYPDWNYDTKVKHILERIPAVNDVRDLTDGTKIRLVVTLKRGSDEDDIDKVIKQLEGSMNYRCNVTTRSRSKDEIPEAMAMFANTTPVQILDKWCTWRAKLEVAALKNELRDLKHKLNREELLLHAINHLDIIFELLKKKGINKVEALADALDISDEDSKYIWSIAVGRLDRLSFDDQREKIKNLKDEIKEVKYFISAPVERIVRDLKNYKEV